MTFKPDKSKFKDAGGRYLTQSLFIENGDLRYAMYTLADTDKEVDGVVYPSLRSLYLSELDPTEYEFANKWLWGWDHWQKLSNNALLKEEIDKWREELEIKLRAVAIRSILTNGLGDKVGAAQWIADGKWKQLRGRPSKAELAREKRVRERAATEGAEEASRILEFMPRKEG